MIRLAAFLLCALALAWPATTARSDLFFMGLGSSGLVNPIEGCNHQNGSGTSTTVACTVGFGVPAGSAVAIFAGGVSQNAASATDDKGDSCTLVQSISSTYHWSSLFCLNLTAGATLFTVTQAATTTFGIIHLYVFSGIKTSAAIDGHAGQAQTTPGTGTNAVTTGSFTPTTNGDLIVASTVNIVANADMNNGTNVPFQSLPQANVATQMRMEYYQQPSAGAIAGDFTALNASDSFLTMAMALEHK